MLVFKLTLIPAVVVVLCCGREGACFQVERQVFSRTFEWEERVGFCTKELVMFEVAMECRGNRFRTSDHSTVSLEPFKETDFNSAQVQLPDDTRGVHARPSRRRHQAFVATGAKCDHDMCGVEKPTLSTS